MPNAFNWCAVLMAVGNIMRSVLKTPLLCRVGALVSIVGAGRIFAAQETIEILYEQNPADDGWMLDWLWVCGFGAVLLLGLLGWTVGLLKRRLQRQGIALQEAEARLREAQLIARIGSWSRNFETGETFWSDEACKVLELEGKAEQYKHYERLIHPDDIERVTETVASAYYQGGNYQCDHRVICPSGKEKYVRFAGQVFIGEQMEKGVLVRETGTIQDITDRRLAELAIQRSEQRLKSILDATPYPIMILENVETYPVLYANRSTYALFDLDPRVTEEFKPQSFWVEPRSLIEFFVKVVADREKLHHEMMLKNSHGRHFWADLCGRCMDFTGVDAILLSLEDISERKRLYLEMERLATTDPLTGVLNRRSLLEATQRELRRSLRYRHPLALLMLDIDYFKRVNDAYGHAFGDDVIRRFCEVAVSCLREEDLFGRIGGEEFCALLVSSEEEGGYLVAERIRKRWQEETFERSGARFNFTVSIGVAQLQNEQESVDDVMERADKGLYGAKRAGRNCVIVHSGDRSAPQKHIKPA